MRGEIDGIFIVSFKVIIQNLLVHAFNWNHKSNFPLFWMENPPWPILEESESEMFKRNKCSVHIIYSELSAQNYKIINVNFNDMVSVLVHISN